MKIASILLTLPGLFMLSSAVESNPSYPIAGIAPQQRPANAPTIEWVQHDHAWFKHALTGVKPPYPHSLYFLDNQGNWYTPFSRPGMNPPYDLRGWHQ